MIEPTLCTFHGIVLGRKAFLIGKVTLLVTFGTPSNFHTDWITFDLVNFHSPYHCVLDRQTFAKLMAASRYAYNMMNIPRSCNIITVCGNADIADQCEDDSAKLADTVLPEETNQADKLASTLTESTITTPPSKKSG
jgi:hypothetical protein